MANQLAHFLAKVEDEKVGAYRVQISMEGEGFKKGGGGGKKGLNGGKRLNGKRERVKCQKGTGERVGIKMKRLKRESLRLKRQDVQGVKQHLAVYTGI